MNTPQELALSNISSFGTGVAFRATDCYTEWETFHFSGSRVIRRNIYNHGRKASKVNLLKSPKCAVFPDKIALEPVGEDE